MAMGGRGTETRKPGIMVTLPYPTNPNLQAVPVYQPGRPIEEVARELGLPARVVLGFVPPSGTTSADAKPPAQGTAPTQPKAPE